MLNQGPSHRARTRPTTRPAQKPSPATAACRSRSRCSSRSAAHDVTGVDLPEAPAASIRASARTRARTPIGLPGLSEPETMRHYVRLSQKNYAHRQRALPARLVHDEAQSAPQREDGAAARLRRHPPAAAALDGAGRDRADRRARPLAARDDRHGVGGDEPEGRRAWRALRHDGDQGGARGARREARRRRAGAGIGARHQPGDRRAPRLHGRRRPGRAPTAPSTRRRSRRCSAPTSPRSC